MTSMRTRWSTWANSSWVMGRGDSILCSASASAVPSVKADRKDQGPQRRFGLEQGDRRELGRQFQRLTPSTSMTRKAGGNGVTVGSGGTSVNGAASAGRPH